jgi:hypothetical protein
MADAVDKLELALRSLICGAAGRIRPIPLVRSWEGRPHRA